MRVLKIAVMLAGLALAGCASMRLERTTFRTVDMCEGGEVCFKEVTLIFACDKSGCYQIYDTTKPGRIGGKSMKELGLIGEKP